MTHINGLLLLLYKWRINFYGFKDTRTASQPAAPRGTATYKDGVFLDLFAIHSKISTQLPANEGNLYSMGGQLNRKVPPTLNGNYCLGVLISPGNVPYCGIESHDSQGTSLVHSPFVHPPTHNNTLELNVFIVTCEPSICPRQ